MRDDDMLRIAADLDMLALTFEENPSADTLAAIRKLQEACKRISNACISPSHLLRLPEEALMRILRDCNFDALAAVSSSCHALQDATGRGASDAISHQFGAKLARLPPRNFHPLARLRWLERARNEAQQWLTAIIEGPQEGRGETVWPKASRDTESCWMEAVARFAGHGRDLAVDLDQGYRHQYEQGEGGATAVRVALRYLHMMARRSAVEETDSYEQRVGHYPAPPITKGALQWVAAQDLHAESDLQMAQNIMDCLLRTFDVGDWKTAVGGGRQEALVAAYSLRLRCEPLLCALLQAWTGLLGPDHASTLAAQAALGEVLAAAECVQAAEGSAAGQISISFLQWGEAPRGEADEVLAKALTAVRRSGLAVTSQLARRIISARAACLSQQGRFAEAAVLLTEVLVACVQRDGGYTRASWGGDGGIGHQIQELARHTRQARPAVSNRSSIRYAILRPLRLPRC